MRFCIGAAGVLVEYTELHKVLEEYEVTLRSPKDWMLVGVAKYQMQQCSSSQKTHFMVC